MILFRVPTGIQYQWLHASALRWLENLLKSSVPKSDFPTDRYEKSFRVEPLVCCLLIPANEMTHTEVLRNSFFPGHIMVYLITPME